MKNSYIKSKPNRIIAAVTIAVLCCCLIIFSGCPLPWYIPKKYGDKKMEQIYGFIKNGLLTDCDNYIAIFEYSDPNDEVQRVASIFNSDGKALLSFDFYTNEGVPLVAPFTMTEYIRNGLRQPKQRLLSIRSRRNGSFYTINYQSIPNTLKTRLSARSLKTAIVISVGRSATAWRRFITM